MILHTTNMIFYVDQKEQEMKNQQIQTSQPILLRIEKNERKMNVNRPLYEDYYFIRHTYSRQHFRITIRYDIITRNTIKHYS